MKTYTRDRRNHKHSKVALKLRGKNEFGKINTT